MMSDEKYVVLETGTAKRPFEVHNLPGGYGKPGWVVFASSKRESAEKRAIELTEAAG